MCPGHASAWPRTPPRTARRRARPPCRTAGSRTPKCPGRPTRRGGTCPCRASARPATRPRRRCRPAARACPCHASCPSATGLCRSPHLATPSAPRRASASHGPRPSSTRRCTRSRQRACRDRTERGSPLGRPGRRRGCGSRRVLARRCCLPTPSQPPHPKTPRPMLARSRPRARRGATRRGPCPCQRRAPRPGAARRGLAARPARGGSRRGPRPLQRRRAPSLESVCVGGGRRGSRV
mmetsp:Transcript_34633/g.98601  ORF Transcript_34633/g.98601 Transcript_34633/m.98601 type:complete len:237 (-) Transcript_34633:69-779(-)